MGSRRRRGAARRLEEDRDLPYGLDPRATQTRLAEIGERLAVRAMPFDEASLARKLDGVADYASQLGELFGGEPSMRANMRAHALDVGGGSPAERLFVVAR